MNKKLVQTPSDTALNLQSRIYGQHDSYNTINETVLEKYNESLLVESVNFMIETNQIQNNTMNYYVVSNQMNNLIVRRGQSFTVCIRFNKPIEPRDILFILQTGSDPVESTGSLIRISITEKIIPSKWSCSISKFDQDYTFQFFAPSNAIFAKWNFIVQTAQRNNSYKYDYLWYKHTKSIIVLFNPWCVDDDIYMQNDEDIQEYILQNYVQIPLGSCIQHYMKCWLVSQYNPKVIEYVLLLLNDSHLHYNLRNNTNSILRKIAYKIIKLTKFLEIQESHTSKINYVRSFNWTSSGSILASYFNNKNRDKEPITVSRNARILLLCTVCRTIGIPCRIVTGFFMSPLQKEYMNINLHWHHSGDDLHELDCDEIHDNHAWLEVWTKCPNFPQTVCWNAFDIAKNDCDDEKKMYGLYPVNLLRDGRTALRTNQLQLYWQINTDVCYNILQKDSSWIIKFDRLKIAETISTVIRNKLTNVVTNYKNDIDSDKEMTANLNTKDWNLTSPDILNTKQDVRLHILAPYSANLGQDIEITIYIQNLTSLQRNVTGKMNVYSAHVDGTITTKVKSLDYNLNLKPIQGSEINLVIPTDDYIYKMTHHLYFRIYHSLEIVETKFVYTSIDDFRLLPPEIAIEIPKTIVVGNLFNCTFSFNNVSPAQLTNCQWNYECTDIQSMITVNQSDTEPYSIVSKTVSIDPQTIGIKQLVLTFTCVQICQISQSILFEVLENE